MKKIILTIIFIFALVGCVAQVESQVKKAKNTCTLSFLRTSLLPDTNTLLVNSGVIQTGTGSTSTTSTNTTTETTNPVTITKDTTRTTTFSSPQTIASLNISGSTITGSVTNASDLHVFTFKGFSTLEGWIIKFNTTTNAVCKIGALPLPSASDSSNLSSLFKTITTTENVVEVTNLTNTYIACVSPNSSLIINNTSTTTPTFPISYSINLKKDIAATSGSSLTSTVTQAQTLATEAKQLKANIDFVNCLNAADAVAEIKEWMLF